MPVVTAWPPLCTMGYARDVSRPGAMQRGMSGAPYYSQSQRSRASYSVTVSMLGPDRTGAGYAEMLKRRLDGRLPLVRIRTLPPLWWGAVEGLGGLRGEQPLQWYSDGRRVEWDVGWTYGPRVMAETVADRTFDTIRCTGLPPARQVAYPGEVIRHIGGQVARAMMPATSDADGVAEIRIDGPLPDGSILIGAPEMLDMAITDWPAVSISTGHTDGTYEMEQVVAEDFAEPLVEEDPWR